MGGDVYDPSKKLSPHNTPVLRALVKIMMDKSDHVVAMSADIRERALRYYQPANDIETIPLGIPDPQYQLKPREAFGLREDDVVLVTVGRLVAMKATRELITLLDALQNPRLKLVVLGDGPERRNLIAMVNSKSLQDQVIFAGFVRDEEKFQYLNISDVYVSTSQHEGFGIVFLEAMACGLPVVCYDNGGQVDFLKNSVTGFLVDHGDQMKFLDKLSCLIEDKSLRVAMGSRNNVVFHLAAAQHETSAPDSLFTEVNVSGTRYLLDACVEQGVKRFIHGSTIGVYGSTQARIDENFPCKPENIYGKSKLDGERLALSYKDRLPVVVIRISETYGPGDRRLLKLFKAVKSPFFFMIGRGRNLHQPIYIDDLIAGFFMAVDNEHAPGEVILLAGKEPITTNDMVRTIAASVDAAPPASGFHFIRSGWWG
jgi:nucleoside-diphosphate-sugar epimerase